MLKIAHITVITPGRCGLYETARELVVGLRATGVDSRLVDPDPPTNPIKFTGTEDRFAPVANMDWAQTADLIVNHSGYSSTPLAKSAQPVIHVSHGRPRSSFLSEKAGEHGIYSYYLNHNSDERWKAIVTFWPEHADYLRFMCPDKPVVVVNPPVDLSSWNHVGPAGYKFHGNKGLINVVSTDAFRDDLDPFVPIQAFALWARQTPGAKLHVYAKSPQHKNGWDPLLNRLRKDGTLGEVEGWVGGLANVYRAADLLITPQTIHTRSVREAMACGCPVLRISGPSLRPDFDVALRQNRLAVRAEAERLFSIDNTAIQFRKVIDRVVSQGIK